MLQMRSTHKTPCSYLVFPRVWTIHLESGNNLRQTTDVTPIGSSYRFAAVTTQTTEQHSSPQEARLRDRSDSLGTRIRMIGSRMFFGILFRMPK